jgi:DhnA family fructose-bisphosphate aldolase class Ia
LQQKWAEADKAFSDAIAATTKVIESGGSFGSSNSDLKNMRDWQDHVRKQLGR